jgi:hypothetical protein
MAANKLKAARKPLIANKLLSDNITQIQIEFDKGKTADLRSSKSDSRNWGGLYLPSGPIFSFTDMKGILQLGRIKK